MKNKTKTYLLIAAVLAIWGVLGFKIINGLSPKKAVVRNDTLEPSFSPKKIAANDTFEIQAVDRDPFLGTFTKKKKTRTYVSKQSNDIAIPTISYLGLIKSQQSSDQIFVVNINNNQHLLKKGQEVNGVKLIRGNSKQIIVRFNNKNETVILD